MKLIIGLGNPGLKYQNTRHNIGFLTIKELSGDLGIPIKKRRYQGLFGKGIFEEQAVGLFMPETYMNLSGKAVKKAVEREKVAFEDALVICDDISLRLGYIRLRKAGSSGGHNGISSIIEELRTDRFPRLRIGIGRSHTISNLAKFVLKPVSSGEKKLLTEAVKDAALCVKSWLKEGPDKAMTAFNKRQSA